MLKIGQNWGKIANYPPNAQHRFAPLSRRYNIADYRIIYTSSVRRIFERGGGGGGGGQEFENYKHQNEIFSAQNQVRFLPKIR